MVSATFLSNPQAARRGARGFALMELMVAFGVMAMAMGLGLMALHMTGRLKRQQGCRDAAREAIELGLERIRSLDQKELPQPGKTQAFTLPPDIAARLPGGRCDLNVLGVKDDPSLLRVRLAVGWASSKETISGEILLQRQKE